MKGKIIANWSKVDFRNPEHLKKVEGAFQAFMSAPDRNPNLKAAIQQFATKGDFPAEVLQVLEKFHATTAYDLGYESIFDVRDFTQTRESGFEILNVSSGLTFAKVLPGQKAEVFKFTGDKATVSFDLYGGALGWEKTLIDDGKYWTLEDNAIAFRNVAYASRAANFYALIEAVAATHDESWAAVTPAGVANTDKDYNAIRDINTINNACTNILTHLKNKGVGAAPNSPFVILAPIQLKSRILRALGLMQQAAVGSDKLLSYNVTPIFTLMLSATDKYYVIFPKAQLKGGYRMDLTLMGMTDILAYTETVAGWMRYGGAIGDIEQIARCATS